LYALDQYMETVVRINNKFGLCILVQAPSGPSEPLPLVMGDFQPTAPAWDLPFVPQVPDVYQEPNADHFQNQHPSRVQEPDPKPPNAQLPKPKPSKLLVQMKPTSWTQALVQERESSAEAM
jgi:hypothetical protein